MAACGYHRTEAVDAFDQYSQMSARLEEQQEMTRAAEKLATEVSPTPSSRGGGGVCVREVYCGMRCLHSSEGRVDAVVG